MLAAVPADLALLDRLPASWRRLWHGRAVAPAAAGMSGAGVYRIGDRFLKIADAGDPTLSQEIERTRWFAAQGIRVPEIVDVHDGDALAMLTVALPGVSAADSPWPAGEIVDAVGRALRALQALSAAACPFDETVPVRLGRARAAIAAGEVDPSEFAARNRGLDPAVLYRRLAAAAPHEEIAVVHGDASLENMIVAADGSVGFVDCGHVGRADRYVDLAVAADDIAERFGAHWLARLAQACGEPAWQDGKAAYFADLYELF